MAVSIWCGIFCQSFLLKVAMPIRRVFSVALIVFILDQATKFAAAHLLAAQPTWPVLKGIFHLTLVRNTGAAFGFLQGGAFFFVIISLFCIVVIILALFRASLFSKVFALDARDGWVRTSLGLILGGACGNLADRLRLSCVVDFLDFRIWPVFNLADSAITIGGIIFFLKILKCEKNSKHQIPSAK